MAKIKRRNYHKNSDGSISVGGKSYGSGGSSGRVSKLYCWQSQDHSDYQVYSFNEVPSVGEKVLIIGDTSSYDFYTVNAVNGEFIIVSHTGAGYCLRYPSQDISIL